MKPSISQLQRQLWIAVFVAGIVLRVAFIWRPADYRLLSSWRESDYTGIARSFYVEGMNILYPKVDWRGDTSGWVEMEFPAIPWVAAALYHVVGYHEEVLRLLSALCSIGSLFAFASLARHLLNPPGDLAATGLFAANGLLFALSGVIQPEPLQLLLTILAAHAALRWLKRGAPADLIKASLWTAVAILAKSPSALLGFLLLYVVLRRMGVRAFTSPFVYASACIAIIPPLLWYVWAHGHFLATGLSLGLSNESHFLNPEMFKPQWLYWIKNLFLMEIRDAYMGVGIVLAAGAFLLPWKRIEFPAIWYASALVFAVVSADTTADFWAYYYRANSVPPVCLLMGAGLLGLGEKSRFPAMLSASRKFARHLPPGLVILTIAAFLVRGAQLEWKALTSPALKPMYLCCKQLAEQVPSGGLIVVRGGPHADEHGHPAAFNASMAFAWMDRKGFNYPSDESGLAVLRSIAQKGGTYWIVQPEDRNDPRLPSVVYREMILLAECESYALFDISPLRKPVPGPSR